MDTNLIIKGYKETAGFLKWKNIELTDENIQFDTVCHISLNFAGRTEIKHGVQMLNTAEGKLIII